MMAQIGSTRHAREPPGWRRDADWTLRVPRHQVQPCCAYDYSGAKNPYNTKGL